MAFVFSGVPCILVITISVIMFHDKRYSLVAPSLLSVRLVLTRNILGLGGQFFVIMVSTLFIFQFVNIILSRTQGPEVVTQYNIAYRYFNVVNMIFIIILNIFWSAFTDAYIKKR